MMTDTAYATPAAARPLPAPLPLLPAEGPAAAPPGITIRLWEGWEADLRFFLTAYLAGFLFFLALLT